MVLVTWEKNSYSTYNIDRQSKEEYLNKQINKWMDE